MRGFLSNPAPIRSRLLYFSPMRGCLLNPAPIRSCLFHFSPMRGGLSNPAPIRSRLFYVSPMRGCLSILHQSEAIFSIFHQLGPQLCRGRLFNPAPIRGSLMYLSPIEYSLYCVNMRLSVIQYNEFSTNWRASFKMFANETRLFHSSPMTWLPSNSFPNYRPYDISNALNAFFIIYSGGSC